MLESARLSLVFTPNRNRAFARLSRAEQRRIEREFTQSVKGAVDEATLRAWLAPAPEVLRVEVGGVQVALDPRDESMTAVNLKRFFNGVLASAGDVGGVSRLSVDPGAELEPICKVKVDGKHVDAVRCPVSIAHVDPASGKAAVGPWFLQSQSNAGAPIETQVEFELEFVAPDP